MRSSELAALAGVTVRTLRHYHQVGVLPEPGRAANGYRRYTVHDLIRLLRVRRLASLGIPLDQVTAVLDSAAGDHQDLLGDLEDELDAEIARLSGQRALIRMIRDGETAPDLPPQLAPFVRTLARAGHSDAMNRLDRDQAVLLAHVCGEHGAEHLALCYERITAAEFAETRRDLTDRFDRLGPDTAAEEVDCFVDEVVRRTAEAIRTIVGELGQREGGTDLIDGATTDLVRQYLHEVLNPVQEKVITRVVARLEPFLAAT